MRTTVDLPDNLHRIALGLARHTGRSLSQAVAELIQRGLDARPSEFNAEPISVHAATGLPVARWVMAVRVAQAHSMTCSCLS